MTVPTIVILAINNALPSGLTGIHDILSLSSLQFVHKTGEDNQQQTLQWQPKVVFASNNGQAIYDGHGRIFTVDTDIHAIDRCAAILIPGFIPNTAGCPPDSITDAATQSWLRKRYQQGALVCGSCSGVFALGEAGILNNKECTTTWWLHDELKQRFPKTKARWASELIDDNGVISAGGPLSWVNITLHVVKQLAGVETAKIVADFSVVDASPRSQSLYIPQGYQSAKSPFVAQAEHAIRKSLYQTVTAKELALTMAVSERTLNRRLKALTNQTPKAFIDSVRIHQACTLLLTTGQSVKEIALSLGYCDDNVFRRLFKRIIKMTPSHYQHIQRERI